MGSFASKWVICPYYHADELTKKKIICDGLCDSTVVETIFVSQKRCKDYLYEVCCTYDYQRCYLAKAQELRHKEIEDEK